MNPGTHLGPYEIQSVIGVGGMGEVYRARDTRLNRVVAIKVLPASVGDDARRRERFDREARAISSLNHPHICTLYDVGHQGGIDYLVMELLDGQTLSERLAKGALPLEEALSHAIQIAGALDTAHRQGIVHRDLKPANVFLARSAERSGPPIAKLLDFGIAKAMSPGTVVATAPLTLTAEGTLLGTVQYMAPEQLEGREADARSDLFAFGAVLYEMLTGRRAFAGSSQSSVIAAVLDSSPPPVATIQPLTPPALEHLVTVCLAKNPDERWQSASDVKRQLEWIAASARSPAMPATARLRSRGARPALWTVAAGTSLAALIAVGALTWYVGTRRQGQSAPPRVTRLTIATSGAAAVSLSAGGRSVAITPNGATVVYIGNKGTQLFVRPLDSLDSTAIFTAVSPLNWVNVSPDGQSVLFGDGNTLKKMALTGGPVATIVSNSAGWGAAWAPDGTIIFPKSAQPTGLQSVSADGGDITVLTRPAPERGESSHVWPEPLPGGRAVLFTITAITGGLDAAQVAVLDLATNAYKVLVRGGSNAHYVPSGHLVYVKGRTLVAVPFDLGRLEISGAAVPVVPRLAFTPNGSGHFDLASDGTLAYVDADMLDAAAVAARTLVWVDRRGHEDPLSASLPARAYLQPRVSPDGAQIAVTISDQKGDIWLWNVARQMLSKLTVFPLGGFFPVWMPDGRHLIFSQGGVGVFWQRTDGIGTAEKLGIVGLASGVTPDGKLLYSPGAKDLMMMALDTRRVETLLATPFNERNAVVSPNGRWLAYESDSSETLEIYVMPLSNVRAAPQTISTAGGTRPVWSRSGEELFYVAPGGAIMAVRVDTRGATLSAGTPVKIVEGPYATGAPVSGRNYDLSPDGKRLLMVKEAPAVTQATPPQLVIVQHWTEELKRLAPLN